MSNFWTEANIEPKRKFRFLLYFNGMPQFVAKSVTKPAFQVATSNHNFLQHKFNFPGRVTWQPITVTIVDPIQPDSTASLYEILKSSGYQIPTDVRENNPAGFGTVNKKQMVDALGGRIQIDTIGPGGSQDIVESWILNNPIITNVSFDTLDYGSDDLLNLTVGIEYDWATLNDEISNKVEKWVGSARYGTPDLE
jgi:hypothetical protein